MNSDVPAARCWNSVRPKIASFKVVKFTYTQKYMLDFKVILLN